MTDLKLAEILPQKDGVKIKVPNLEPIHVLYEWLRDHCRCTECYNETTHQRKLSILDFPSNIIPREYKLSEGILNVSWDDGHRSKYELNWLVKNGKFVGDDTGKIIKTIPWLKLPNIARVELKSYINTETGLKDVISSLLRYGVAIVTGVEPTLGATEKVITRISQVQKTFFGEMWEIIHDSNGSKETDIVQDDGYKVHNDTAYISIALGAHTDNTYWCDAAGLQAFHCITPATCGGETLLVDGLSVSNRLKREYPKSYKRLTQVPVSATYIEKGQYHSYVDPIIKLDPVTKDFLQIRFNLYDRSVVRTVRCEDMKEYYSDLRLIASIVSDKNGENYMKLSPGEVMFIDNWRVMHGRSAFSGFRHLSGAYVGRTDWRSKAAVLGLVDNV